jgi:hypothetical protein
VTASRAQNLAIGVTSCDAFASTVATAHEREVAGMQLEVVVVAQTRDERRELLGRKVDHVAARLAHEMLVVERQVVDRRPVADVDVLDDPHAHQRFHRSVDRGEVDRRLAEADQTRDLVDREMVVATGEELDHEATRLGDALTAHAEQPERPFDVATVRSRHRIHATSSHLRPDPDDIGAAPVNFR